MNETDYDEGYKKGYQDALAYINGEFEFRIRTKEMFLEKFSDEDYVSSVAATNYNIKVGLGVAKIIVDKKLNEL